MKINFTTLSLMLLLFFISSYEPDKNADLVPITAKVTVKEGEDKIVVPSIDKIVYYDSEGGTTNISSTFLNDSEKTFSVNIKTFQADISFNLDFLADIEFDDSQFSIKKFAKTESATKAQPLSSLSFEIKKISEKSVSIKILKVDSDHNYMIVINKNVKDKATGGLTTKDFVFNISIKKEESSSTKTIEPPFWLYTNRC